MESAAYNEETTRRLNEHIAQLEEKRAADGKVRDRLR
jgi:hypothetical protein